MAEHWRSFSIDKDRKVEVSQWWWAASSKNVALSSIRFGSLPWEARDRERPASWMKFVGKGSGDLETKSPTIWWFAMARKIKINLPVWLAMRMSKSLRKVPPLIWIAWSRKMEVVESFCILMTMVNGLRTTKIQSICTAAWAAIILVRFSVPCKFFKMATIAWKVSEKPLSNHNHKLLDILAQATHILIFPGFQSTECLKYFGNKYFANPKTLIEASAEAAKENRRNPIILNLTVDYAFPDYLRCYSNIDSEESVVFHKPTLH